MTTKTREIDVNEASVSHYDGETMLVNTPGFAWRVINGGWRRAGEGETSRDGLWVVGGSQWRYGC